MKVAVLGVRYNQDTQDLNVSVKNALEKAGVKVDFSYFETTLDEDMNKLDEAHKRNQKIIKNSDFIVAEITQYSLGIGYLMGSALEQKKPVLALYNKKRGELRSNAIQSTSKSKKMLKYVEYEDKSELDGIVKKYISEVKQMLDTKFILIISAQIDRYLEWASSNRRMHKAQIVRNAVEDAMAKDKDWKNHNKSV